jgi:hypothetical protein
MLLRDANVATLLDKSFDDTINTEDFAICAMETKFINFGVDYASNVGQMDTPRIRMKTCRSCCEIDCVCHGLGNDEAKSSQNMEPESFVKADGSPLDPPDDAPWPFTILFVGVVNGY